MPRRHPPPTSPFTNLFSNLADAIADAGEDLMNTMLDNMTTVAQPGLAPDAKGERKAKTPGKKRVGAGTPREGRATAPAASVQRENTLYDVLEVAPRCSPETLSAAFRSLSSHYHPDRWQTKQNRDKHEEKYKAITAAWSVLKDPAKRKQYDQSIGLQPPTVKG